MINTFNNTDLLLDEYIQMSIEEDQEAEDPITPNENENEKH
jgi:hypothetical protein